MTGERQVSPLTLQRIGAILIMTGMIAAGVGLALEGRAVADIVQCTASSGCTVPQTEAAGNATADM